MGVQNSINSMIASATMVAGSKALKGGLNDMEASKKAHQELNVKIEAMTEQRRKFQEKMLEMTQQNNIPVVEEEAVRVSNIKIPGGK